MLSFGLLGLLGLITVLTTAVTADSTSQGFNSIAAEPSQEIRTNGSKIVYTTDLDQWVPPKGFAEKFPYMLSGFDDENRPIWIIEIGKFQFRDAVLQGAEMQENLSKYILQFAYRVRKSRTRFDPLGKTNFILDFEGLSFPQFAEINTIAYMLRLATDYKELLDSAINKAVLVNANYVTETLVNLVRPIFGRIFANVEIYGTNRAKWLPHILRHFPKEKLPEYYGGFPGYKPVNVYG